MNRLWRWLADWLIPAEALRLFRCPNTQHLFDLYDGICGFRFDPAEHGIEVYGGCEICGEMVPLWDWRDR